MKSHYFLKDIFHNRHQKIRKRPKVMEVLKRYNEPNGPQSIHCRCKLICTCLWLKVSE